MLGGTCDNLSYDLFCYCGNSPAFKIDIDGCAWLELIATLVAVTVTVAHVVNAAVSIYNGNNRKNNDTTNIVHDQSSITMSFGVTTFAQAGCGAAAAHNAIILAGGSSKLSSVVRFMESHSLTLCKSGASCTNVHWYLRRQGYSPKMHMTKLKGNIDNTIKKCKRSIAVLLYKHSTGNHFVAIQYERKNKIFYKYNPDSTHRSIDEWLSKNNYTSVSLITI